MLPSRLASTPGIVLAGTFPWANSPFDRLLPRPLVPVAHRPLIGFALTWMQSAGIGRAIVCGNRNSRALETQVLRQYSDALDISFMEDSMPRGAAGCVRDATSAYESHTFVVTDGAAIPNVDLQALLETHAQSAAAMTMVVYHEDSARGHALLSVPAGVYVFDRRVLELIPRTGFVDIKEHLIPKIVRSGDRIATFVAEGAVPRVLDAETYLAVNEIGMQSIALARWEASGYEVRGEALVHRDAQVSPSAILTGPTVIAHGAVIESDAVVVGPTSIGCDVVVGGGAVVSRSAVWRRSRIEAESVVDRSIIGDDGLVPRGRHVSRSIVTGSGERRGATPTVAPLRMADATGPVRERDAR